MLSNQKNWVIRPPLIPSQFKLYKNPYLDEQQEEDGDDNSEGSAKEKDRIRQDTDGDEKTHTRIIFGIIILGNIFAKTSYSDKIIL